MKDRLLWVDDEIDILRPHVMFLEAKGYEVSTVTNGFDAVELCRNEVFDLIFLDENMPGMSGLETLSKIKDIRPEVPVIMITKSEEENIMDMAIGAKIADYLIKPVNPKQILLSIKKNLHKKEIITEFTSSNYQQNFAEIGMRINEDLTAEGWKDLYKKLVYWELELEKSDSNMYDVLKMQKSEANNMFARFIKNNYIDWLNDGEHRPMLSPDIFKRVVFPELDKGRKIFFILLDNFRLDQWRTFSPELAGDFMIEEDLYYSILPTATQYARNAVFSGLMPKQISEMFPELWVDEDEEEGKNLNEEPLIATQIKRYRRNDTFSYNKINDSSGAQKLIGQINNLKNNSLNVIVINFIDMMSHARTESKMIRELASTEAAYRSITLSWFRHSLMKELFATIADTGFDLIVTTDHGSIRVDNPVKVVGDKNTNTNLRYKVGKNLSYNPKQVFEIKKPDAAFLPALNVSSSYIFATKEDFFAYPNNYNYYVSYYNDTFQHGGISMEEMIIPIVKLQSKRNR